MLPLGIDIRVTEMDNDKVFNTHHWEPSDLINFLMEFDIHVIPTHGHQANIARGGENRLMWTANEYIDKLNLLRYHLGYPMGKYLQCPVYLQDKILYLDALKQYCTPTIHVEIPQSYPYAPEVEDYKKIAQFAAFYGPYCSDKFIGMMLFSCVSLFA